MLFRIQFGTTFENFWIVITDAPRRYDTVGTISWSDREGNRGIKTSKGYPARLVLVPEMMKPHQDEVYRYFGHETEVFDGRSYPTEWIKGLLSGELFRRLGGSKGGWVGP